MGAVISWLRKYDETMSEKIHKMKHSWSMDYCLYIPATAFNGPIGFVFCCIMYAVFFTNVE